jgi:hypothetical protein
MTNATSSPAGTYLNNGVITPDPGGTYSGPNATSPTTDAAGTYSSPYALNRFFLESLLQIYFECQLNLAGAYRNDMTVFNYYKRIYIAVH